MGPAPWDLIRLDLSDIGYIPFHICNICGIFIYFSLVLYSSLFFFFFGKQRIELIIWIDFTFPCSESHCFLGNNSNWTNRWQLVHGCYCFFSYLCRVALKINQIDWSKYFESIAHSHCSPLSIHVQMVDFLKRDFFLVFSVDIVDCWERVFLCGFTCVGHS